MEPTDNNPYIEDLKKTQNILWETLRDLTSIQKHATFDQIVSIERDLIQNAHHPYYCRKCRQKHGSGKKYSDHMLYADPILKFPPIKYPKFDEEIVTQIVGVYYTGNGEYLKTLQKNEYLTLLPEPTNPHDANAISVWHLSKKLGYLPREKNQMIGASITAGKIVKCRLGKYLPKIHRFSRYFKRRRNRYWNYDEDDDQNAWDESTFRPERAEITVFIQQPIEISVLLENLAEMVGMGFPIVAQDFAEMGFETLKLLESLCQTSEKPEYKKILSAVFSQFQVELGSNDPLSILL